VEEAAARSREAAAVVGVLRESGQEDDAKQKRQRSGTSELCVQT
jgi:hypothetical protein